MSHRIVTHPSNDAYRNGYDAIFGKKQEEIGPYQAMIRNAFSFLFNSKPKNEKQENASAKDQAEAWVPVVVSETDHYVVFKTPDYPGTSLDSILFLERLLSLGYRYIKGDSLIVCEKMKVVKD